MPDNVEFVIIGIVVVFALALLSLLFSKKKKSVKLPISYWADSNGKIMFVIFQVDVDSFSVVTKNKEKVEPATFKTYYDAINFIKIQSKSVKEIMDDPYFISEK